MRTVIFCHSLLSDWNHGNAHFLRGIASESIARGHSVRIFEPRDAWSAVNLEAEHGPAPFDAFRHAYPELSIERYDPATLRLDEILAEADLVLVHEWNDPTLVDEIGRRLARMRESGQDECVLLFHDTHHRSITNPDEIRQYDLSQYDGVLAFGDPIRDAYIRHGWASRAWTWHEAADIRRFAPKIDAEIEGDLVWIGNWGDEERTAELHEFLIEPIRRLGIRARVYGVRYPESAKRTLEEARIEYGGWLPNFRVPEVFARFRLTLHIPRAPYVRALPGIPTIRPFEALACGIPLIVALWDTAGDLFTPGADFLFARTSREMEAQIRRLLHDPGLRTRLAAHGRETILARHTCAHRVDELSAIVNDIQKARRAASGRKSSTARSGEETRTATAQGATVA